MNHLTSTISERIAITYSACNLGGRKEQLPDLTSAHLLINLGFFCNLEKEYQGKAQPTQQNSMGAYVMSGAEAVQR